MGKRKMTNNEKAGLIAIIGGILMLLAGASGAAAWTSVGNVIVDMFNNESLRLPFQILALLGSLGGFIVILGGLLIHGKYIKMKKKDQRIFFGKLSITIGAGMGVIGLLIFLIVAVMNANPEASIIGAVGIGFVGLILTIVARMKTK